MTKHISDKPRDNGSQRLLEYTRQERESRVHPAITALHCRPKDRGESRKATEYARIERGRTA